MKPDIHRINNAHILAGVLACIAFLVLFENSVGYNSSDRSIDINASISVNFNDPVAVNNLSLGVMLSTEVQNWLSSPVLQKEAASCNFSTIRIHDLYTMSQGIGPCLSWNETDHTGTYNWASFDTLARSIYDIGAIPLVCLGHYAWTTENSIIPYGMAINPLTDLPYPESYASYCADFLRHFDENAWKRVYWEIWNEPQSYVFQRDDNGDVQYGVYNETRLEAMTQLFNVSSEYMRRVDPEAFVGVNIDLYKGLVDYFAEHADPVSFISFHKYDGWGTPQNTPQGYLSDDEILQKASQIGGDQAKYTIREVQQIWRNLQGTDVKIFCTETNLNSDWIYGSDPRIQQILGAVWYAEELKAFVLNDVKYSIYYCFVSDEKGEPTGGVGFGMVNATSPHATYYPYLTSYLLGTNLAVGDSIFKSSSTNSEAVSVMAWRNGDAHNILLINKKSINAGITVDLLGISMNGIGNISLLKIDGSNSSISTETVSSLSSFNVSMNGYSVILLSF